MFYNPKILVFILLLVFSKGKAQKENIEIWKYQTENRIYSSPTSYKNIIFIGNNEGVLNAINIKTGKPVWQFKSGDIISSKPCYYDGNVFFESGNTIYSLNAKTGTKNWELALPCKKFKLRTDQWDYHHASIKIFNKQLFFASSNGVVYQIDPSNSTIFSKFSSLDKIPIRTTPNVKNGVLYFGDWNGVIYAFDINTKKNIWTYKSVKKKPYPTFGGILSQIIVSESHLYFGARNNNVMALKKETGNLSWAYSDTTGGWISGDPILENDKLYIGGSDNHKFFCFEAKSGKILWEHKFFGNCLTKPVIVKNKIIFTTGDAYKNIGDDKGKGVIYVLKKDNGELINQYEFPGNVFSSPHISKGKIFLGCDDGNVYSISLNKFITPKVKM